LIPFLIPFALISDVEVATAIWEGLTVVFVVSALSLAQDHLRRRISPIPVVLSILWFYTLLMIFLGQINGLILAGIGIGYWAYRHQFDLLAGVLISATFVKPDLVILPVVTLVAFALIRRRWKFILGVLTGLLGLLVVSVSLAGWWPGAWVETIQRDAQYAKVVWPLGLLWSFSPLLIVGVIALTIILIVRFRNDQEGLLITSIPLQIILFPQTLMWGLTMLCLPLVIAWSRGSKKDFLWVWLLGWALVAASSNPE
jgi:hypothetical protein